jgi:hypothetical protein
LPLVVSFPGQNAQLVIQPAATAPRCATNQNVFGSMDRPCCQLSIELFCFDFDVGRDRFHSLAPTKKGKPVGSQFMAYFSSTQPK